MNAEEDVDEDAEEDVGGEGFEDFLLFLWLLTLEELSSSLLSKSLILLLLLLLPPLELFFDDDDEEEDENDEGVLSTFFVDAVDDFGMIYFLSFDCD